MEKLVSVIMSTYNEDIETVKLSIESILNQSYTNIEFIIVLDNPKNLKLKDLLFRYKEKDKRIKLIFNKQNVGLVASLNTAIEHASGIYIARMDADDISLPDRIIKQKEYLENQNLDFIFSNMILINEEGNEIGRTKNEPLTRKKLFKLLRLTNISLHPTWFLKKDLYIELNGYRNVKHCEDYDFILRCLEKGYKIGKFNKYLLKYRIRGNSISQSNSLEQFLNAHSLSLIYKERKLEDISLVNKAFEKNVSLLNVRNEKNFNKANKIFIEGLNQLKSRRYNKAGIYILKSFLISKYYFNKNIIFIKCKIISW